MLSNFNIGVQMISLFLASLAAAGMSCLFLSRLALKNTKSLTKRGSLYSKLVYLTRRFLLKRSHEFRIFSLSLLFFFYLSQVILISNIKTNKVVVSTSELIKGPQDLLDSRQPVCFMDRNTEISMAIRSPKSTLISRLFYEKTKIEKNHEKLRGVLGDRCLLQHDPKIAQVLLEGGLLVLTQIEGTDRRKKGIRRITISISLQLALSS